MPKRLTKEEYIAKLAIENSTVELISDYNGNKNEITVRCKIDNHIWKTTPNRLHSGQGCQKCYDRRRGQSTKIPLAERIKEAQEIYKNEDGMPIYYYGLIDEAEYKNSHQRVPIVCPKHGIFYQSFTKHIKGLHSCPICTIERNSSLRRLGKDEFVRRAEEIHKDENGESLYIYDKVEYINCETPVCITCKKHGDFWQSPYSHLMGYGCKKCNLSHLEKDVMKFLNDKKIEFIYQASKKDFEWLNLQTFDFYIPKLNLAIECQGGQHFKPIEHFGGNEQFEIIKERDLRKFKLAKGHNLNIIYLLPSSLKTKKEDILLKEGEENQIYSKDNLYFLDEIEQLIQ